MTGPYKQVPIPDPRKLKNHLKKHSTKDSVHEGLKSASTSHKHRRHHKNAYIILVGQTGAGKSTTINTLFGQNLTAVGDYTSTTSEITEYASHVPSMHEIGVTNSEIHIIDTPGLGDTRGIEQDAKFIATLEEFIQTHPELKGCYPTALLLVAKFDDNRVEGGASPFVRMLKGIKLIENSLIDPEHTNVIIVLTHYMHAKRKVQKDPQPNYEIIKTLVKEHVGFPSPIIVVGAENDGDEYELPMQNGYYHLPGGEYYPYNLFDAIQKQCGQYDPMGEHIVRIAFSDPLALNAKTVYTKLLIEDAKNVLYAKAIVELIGNQFKNQSSQISDRLRLTWETIISPPLRKTYPEALAVTQSIFHMRNIREIKDIPESSIEKVKLLKQIPQNEAILCLLSKGLYIHPPLLKIPYFVGQGYDLLKDEAIPSEPFSMLYYTDQKLSPLGYLLPVEISCEIINNTDEVCTIVDHHEDYIKHRLNDLGLAGTVGSTTIMGGQEFKPGYNNFSNPSRYSLLREHRKFKLSLTDKVQFTKWFREDLEKLPKPSAIPDCVDKWKDFFAKYGTHVVSEAYGGGSIELVQDLSDQLDNKVGHDNFVRKMINIDAQVEAGVDLSKELPELLQNIPILRGGDVRLHNFSNVPLEDMDTRIENWEETLDVDPVMLGTKLRLIPLSNYVRTLDPKKATDIESAMGIITKSLANLQVVKQETFIPPLRKDVRPYKLVDRSSCLKKGTLILMEDYTNKPVEELMAGDKILDKDFNSCSVLGCNYFFLGERQFYGFSQESQFFTEVHIFVGPNMEFKVVSKNALLEENPVFESFGVISEMEGDFPILSCRNKEIYVETCQLYSDATKYPLDTPVYFIEVDSPSGTYFANGYLCRHELPPFHLWPETFDCLQKMMLSPNVVLPILQEPFTPTTLSKFSTVAKSIAESIQNILENDKEKLTSSSNLSDTQPKCDVFKNLGLVLSNQSLAAFGLLLYSKCGKILYENLDKKIKCGSNTSLDVEMLQKIVLEKIQMYF